ncbi:MAG: ATP-binding cassette domain-containing protein [Bacteroidales bacterium]|nr:ATP-binding cassette domain-containing protein [Candidatus Cryptobacteroides choladohippi]
MATAIEFNNISKQYRLGLVSTRTLSHDLDRWWKVNVLHKEDPYLKIGSVNDRSSAADSEYVWALKDIDFKVEQGDVVGIIGKNGAGKSTLLKLLSKITAPTTGTINARGRIGALLEVGTGFHPEMTGRENIYLNGAIMGMSKQEISRKLDEIVDFSGCERYIDTPVKRYSSGMTVRLGFAVAAHLEPEILVVDEVLAVGDAEFQKKAIGKMQDVSRGEGRTVLFVSHNMASVKQLCRNGIVLKNGGIEYMGTALDAVNHYINSNISALNDYYVSDSSSRSADVLLEMEYLEVRMLNDVNNMSNEEPIHIQAKVRRNNKRLKQCQFGVVIRNQADECACACYSNVVELPEKGDIFDVDIVVPNHNLVKGTYSINMNISINDYAANIRDFDLLRNVLSFDLKYVDAGHQHAFSMWALPTNCAILSGKTEITHIE